jgi:hypothetical protein
MTKDYTTINAYLQGDWPSWYLRHILRSIIATTLEDEGSMFL